MSDMGEEKDKKRAGLIPLPFLLMTIGGSGKETSTSKLKSGFSIILSFGKRTRNAKRAIWGLTQTLPHTPFIMLERESGGDGIVSLNGRTGSLSTEKTLFKNRLKSVSHKVKKEKNKKARGLSKKKGRKIARRNS